MNFINCVMTKTDELQKLKSDILNSRLPAAAYGLSHIHRVVTAGAIISETKRAGLYITADEFEMKKARDDFEALGYRVLEFPSRDFTPREVLSHSKQFEQMRTGTLSKIIEGDFDVVVTTAEAAMSRTIPKGLLESRFLVINSDTCIKKEILISKLLAAGYIGCTQVENAGEFAVRGSVFDIFSPNYSSPCRIDFWDESIDSISFFDIETQRRTEATDAVTVTPAAENTPQSVDDLAQRLFTLAENPEMPQKYRNTVLSDRDNLLNGLQINYDAYLSQIFDEFSTIFDYFEDTVFVSDTAMVYEKAAGVLKTAAIEFEALLEEGVLSRACDLFYITDSRFKSELSKKGCVFLDSFQKGNYEVPILSVVGFGMREISPFSPTVDQLKSEISVSKEHTTVILAGQARTAEGLATDLNETGIKAVFCGNGLNPCEGGVYVVAGSLSSGFEIPSQQFTLIAYATQADRKRRRKKRTAGDIGSLDELRPGDYVVHESHGIGIFDGITSMVSQGVANDYIKIRYLGRDVLYVPVTSLNLVSRYIGPREDAAVKLHRLGSSDWKKTRARTKSAVKDIAKELTALYAKRMQLKGYAFGPDTDLQLDFEHRFKYEETEDQLICSEEIKRDMQRPIPMDRLLCGDVGFGKTEVALRAAFKCIADGKQCAILVPTTILAWQHFNTAIERFSYLPINIEMLSRFRTPKQQESIKKRLKNGGIDLIIGTHKLFAADISFNDLGLLIVDEEQRFGVSQKEKLKERFPVVDVLTLSATPIPRTLNMALAGLRDMSSIEDPPHDRLPVQTYVIEHDASVIVQAVTKEVRRNGQVFYLHNRTDTIVQTASALQKLLPDIRIGIAHGRMDEGELSAVWKRMLEHEIDLLVCTTIIETGVDVPNANTLIIENADCLGLSQLHQIRGRVGRSSRRAYAYLLFRPDKVLSEVSQKRLRTIRDFTEFGSGFKIAMRDLEIRGAGNILGSQQHGHMEAVGYDMYLKLLNRAIEEEKGITGDLQEECAIEINVNANIPEGYIASLPTRLSIYRRIAAIKDEEDARDVIDELIDRFGSFDRNVENLIDIAIIKAKATRLGILKIRESNRSLILQLSESPPPFLPVLYANFKKNITVIKKEPPCVSISISDCKNSLAATKNIIEIIDEFSRDKTAE